jgi:hypothetical protein
MPGVKVSKQIHDVDSGERDHGVETSEGPRVIKHGSGPTWSSGLPEDFDVWRSVKYEEVVYAIGAFAIIDARGQLANEKWWRYFGKGGESAFYGDLDESPAKTLLDRVLDGACLKPR